MLIIDKNNDFYDHISYIYGVDKKVVFDRRGSSLITDEDITKLGYWENYDHEFFYNSGSGIRSVFNPSP